MMYDFRALVARHATALPNLRTTLARIERARDENPDVEMPVELRYYELLCRFRIAYAEAVAVGVGILTRAADKAALRCDFCERPYRLAVDGIRFCKRHAEEADVRPHGKIGG